MNFSKTENIYFIGGIAVIYAIIVQKAINSDSILLLLSIPGFFVGIYFYSNPLIGFWALFYNAMFAGIAVSYIPGMYNVRWGINFIVVLLAINMLMKIMFRQKTFRLRHCAIFYLFGLFFLYSLATSLVNGVPLKQLIISLKNYFQFFPLLFFFLVYPLSQTFSRQILKAITIVALFQPPIVLFQYFFVVPHIKQLTAVEGAAVLDAVNGSFGVSLAGGGTGMYTLFTCTILCGLIIAYSQKIIGITKYLIFSIYILFPMFLNETKAAFIFLFLGSISVIGLSRNINMAKKILLLFMVVLIGGAMLWFTLQVASLHGRSSKNSIERTLSYNFGEQGYASYRLNRLTCITFWWQENKNKPIELLTGYGLDSTIEGESGLSTTGNVAKRYPMYGTGLTTASRMLWETGVIGFTLFLIIFLVSFKNCLKLAQSNQLTFIEKFLALYCTAGISMAILLFFYNSLFRNSQPANFLISLMIGITIYLTLRQRALAKSSTS